MVLDELYSTVLTSHRITFINFLKLSKFAIDICLTGNVLAGYFSIAAQSARSLGHSFLSLLTSTCVAKCVSIILLNHRLLTSSSSSSMLQPSSLQCHTCVISTLVYTMVCSCNTRSLDNQAGKGVAGCNPAIEQLPVFFNHTS